MIASVESDMIGKVLKSVYLSALTIAAIAPPVLALEPIVTQQEPNAVLRKSCTILSPDYNGSCRYTVVTIGPNRDMNIHFDLSRNGDVGITFGLIRPIKTGAKDVTMSFGALIWRSSRDNSKRVEGICVISKPTAAKQEYSCKSNNGMYKAIGSGVLKDYFVSGAKNLKNRDYKGAIEHFTRSIIQDPNVALTYAERALAKLQTKDFRGSLNDYNTALSMDPNLTDLKGIYRNRGVAKYETGNVQGGCADYKKAASLGDQSTAQWLNSEGGAWYRNMR